MSYTKRIKKNTIDTQLTLPKGSKLMIRSELIEKQTNKIIYKHINEHSMACKNLNYILKSKLKIKSQKPNNLIFLRISRSKIYKIHNSFVSILNCA